jgi:FlaA1/EpsC-like NDP-sugar epimerase
MLKNASILITGGTGSFSHVFVPMTLKIQLEALSDSLA